MISLVNGFADWLYQVGYSEGTQNMLPACVREFLQQQRITDISDIAPAQVRAFYAWLPTRPLKKRSGALSEMMIHHYVYALRIFFTWLEVTEQIDRNPISGMAFKRPRQNGRCPLSPEEIRQLFAAARGLKETALLHLFYSCGLRRSEGAALNIADVRYKEQLLYVRAGKGAKRRVVPMTAAVAKELETYWLEERCGQAAKKVKDEEAFMLNRIGRRMSGAGYNDLFKELAIRAGLSPEITLHHLRHSIANHLLQRGMPLEYVRDFLGHYFLETTQLYARPSAEQLSLL
ncbi:MAG TPA: tyrosine-type recombinase/integrase [Candidatus Sulfotelmatobacter sp.]|nr:tyrosine-type recombinase/integrase [Candidatus Sulfotelmatobacter sp.]